MQYSAFSPRRNNARPTSAAEALMRSRYSGYATGHLDHVFRTWHPRTRPSDVTDSPGLVWTRLDVLDVVDGGPDDDTGEVEFRAHFQGPDGSGTMQERSRFGPVVGAAPTTPRPADRGRRPARCRGPTWSARRSRLRRA